MVDDNDQFADEIARMKRVAREHNARSLRWLAGSAVAAVVIGVITWFGARPIDRDDAHIGMVLGLAGLAFFLPCMLFRLFYSRPAASCPRCDYVWDVPQEGGHDWMTWNRCPGCGLKMGGGS